MSHHINKLLDIKTKMHQTHVSPPKSISKSGSSFDFYLFDYLQSHSTWWIIPSYPKSYSTMFQLFL